VAQVPLAEDNDMIKTAVPYIRSISILHIHSAMAIVVRLAVGLKSLRICSFLARRNSLETSAR
jgi:hypothetical protein